MDLRSEEQYSRVLVELRCPSKIGNRLLEPPLFRVRKPLKGHPDAKIRLQLERFAPQLNCLVVPPREDEEDRSVRVRGEGPRIELQGSPNLRDSRFRSAHRQQGAGGEHQLC